MRIRKVDIEKDLRASNALVKGHDEHGPIRYMSPEEIKERVELNINNTSESLRKRVLSELAKRNGHADSQ